MTDDAERAAFEAWMRDRGCYDYELNHDLCGYYHNDVTRDRWTGWQARAEIARREAVGWQPIESAPRDDKQVLVWTTFEGMFAVVCIDGDWNNGDINLTEDMGGVPTHWMPLPAPPAPLAPPP